MPPTEAARRARVRKRSVQGHGVARAFEEAGTADKRCRRTAGSVRLQLALVAPRPLPAESNRYAAHVSRSTNGCAGHGRLPCGASCRRLEIRATQVRPRLVDFCG